MRIYGITELGKKVMRSGTVSSEELRVLQYVRDNKATTDESLDVIADRWIVRKLKDGGLIKELKP